MKYIDLFDVLLDARDTTVDAWEILQTVVQGAGVTKLCLLIRQRRQDDPAMIRGSY